MEIKNRHLCFEDVEVFELEKYPKNCPICHTAISVEPYFNAANVVNVNNFYDGQFNDYDIQAIFRCPECYQLFISTYARRHQAGIKFWLISNLPQHHKKVDFKKEIKQLSLDFVVIYQQAHIAESQGLDQIAGCGYRKSLEFLIKDYCIKFLQKDRDIIANKFLGNCIENDLDNQEIKDCAKRATWIGNDESHYIKKWEKHDLQSLKTLIDLTQNWIMMSILTKQYKQDMN